MLSWWTEWTGFPPEPFLSTSFREYENGIYREMNQFHCCFCCFHKNCFCWLKPNLTKVPPHNIGKMKVKIWVTWKVIRLYKQKVWTEYKKHILIRKAKPIQTWLPKGRVWHWRYWEPHFHLHYYKVREITLKNSTMSLFVCPGRGGLHAFSYRHLIIIKLACESQLTEILVINYCLYM